jgi:hypothetical protein
MTTRHAFALLLAALLLREGAAAGPPAGTKPADFIEGRVTRADGAPRPACG